MPLKATVTKVQNGLWGDEPAEDGSDIICVRVADFDRSSAKVKLAGPTFRSIPERQQPGRLLHPGDLLLEKSGGGEKQPVGFVARVESLPSKAVCSNFIARMQPARGFDPKFLSYLHGHLYSRRVNTRSIKQSTGIQNLDSAAYLSEQVAIPAEPLQRAIAAYLDRETARIDTLIGKKEFLLALLEEKRTALISQAVTKGLDPDVPMQDSGVEWLGEVPAHWEVARTKHVARLESGHTPSRSKPEYWVDCTVPWFTLADVHQLRGGDREVVSETKELVSDLGLANSSARKLPAGTVLLSRTASVGFSGIMGCDMATTQDFVNWTPGPRIDSAFLLYVFRGMKPFFRRLTMGSTHQTIYMPEVQRFSTPLPPVDEQRAIVDHIRRDQKRFARLTSATTRAIHLLREYRSALISAAVSGQLPIPAPDVTAVPSSQDESIA